MTVPIYINEDNLVRMDRVKLASDGTYVNAGTFSYALKDSLGAIVSSGSLFHVAGTRGRWQAAIDVADVAALAIGDVLWLEITMSNGSGADGFRRVECQAQYHGEEP